MSGHKPVLGKRAHTNRTFGAGGWMGGIDPP